MPLLLDGAPLKGPIIALSLGTNILPPKNNEKLLGVKTNKKGKVIYAKYTTGECTYYEGVRAHPSKVKFIPPKEDPKSAMVLTVLSITPRIVSPWHSTRNACVTLEVANGFTASGWWSI